jgi:YfiH family protein
MLAQRNIIPDSGLIAIFSSRFSKNMSLFYGDTGNCLINRKNFLSPLGINYQDLVCARQIHRSNVRRVGVRDRGKGALSYETSIDDTDALITDVKNLPLAVFTADCLSIFLYEPEAAAIGLVHAGWRSIKENITAKTVKSLEENLNAKIKNLYVGFGPAIRGCCYEVGKEFKDIFPSEVLERDNRLYLDLIAINKKQLLDLGIRENNIFDCEICTSCRNWEFFSYRKEGISCGRMVSVVMLR